MALVNPFEQFSGKTIACYNHFEMENTIKKQFSSMNIARAKGALTARKRKGFHSKAVQFNQLYRFTTK